jgi:hypothetical protein
MGLAKTFTSEAVVIICKLLTEKVVIGLPLLVLWRNTIEEWMNNTQKDCPRIIG